MNIAAHTIGLATEGARIVSADAAGVEEAARLLREGRLVAFPTETVYGLGGDATSAHAVAGIYAAKGRPSFNPLIAHIASFAAAREEGVFSDAARILAEAFWPGPLTLVVPAAGTTKVCALARAGLDSVALRVPSHPLARQLLELAGRPIAAPSANRSGRVSPTRAAHVTLDLGIHIDFILDGGTCPVGIESTIVSCLEERPQLLRPGGLTRADIEAVLGYRLENPDRPLVVAPGMLASHYAPEAQLRLAAHLVSEDEAGLDFGGRFPPRAGILDLSPTADLREATANLFDYLHMLDADHPRRIAVAAIPRDGLGEAINDRLERAAAPRV